MARGVVDTFISYKFLQILTRSWEEQEAFKHGIIDERGKLLRSSRTLKTRKEKNSFTVFHRLIFNVKRLLEKLPFGKTKLGSFAAGLLLLKEGISDDSEILDLITEESKEKLGVEEIPKPSLGTYFLVNPVLIGENDEGKVGDFLSLKSNQVYDFFGEWVVCATHKKTKNIFYVSLTDIKKAKQK